ncbi:hypothetical protein B0H17DRAFT_1133285 [Mycena rosella]|uniref:Uncharacterized protein n=1 Tax=Mycena rosella TaxID=1033263 RepID=A0AAD7DI65_MYCRO|nr:hypothetical protein B0H17DRAFT_1133285 [Mycena rosella]
MVSGANQHGKCEGREIKVKWKTSDAGSGSFFLSGKRKEKTGNVEHLSITDPQSNMPEYAERWRHTVSLVPIVGWPTAKPPQLDPRSPPAPTPSLPTPSFDGNVNGISHHRFCSGGFPSSRLFSSGNGAFSAASADTFQANPFSRKCVKLKTLGGRFQKTWLKWPFRSGAGSLYADALKTPVNTYSYIEQNSYYIEWFISAAVKRTESGHMASIDQWQ